MPCADEDPDTNRTGAELGSCSVSSGFAQIKNVQPEDRVLVKVSCRNMAVLEMVRPLMIAQCHWDNLYFAGKETDPGK